MKIGWIASGKLHTSEIVDMHIIEISIDMVAQLIVVIRIHDIAHPILNIVAADISPCYGDCIHGDDAGSMLLLVAKRMRQTERYLDVALGLESLGDTVIGCCESSEYVGRILPSEH